MNRHTRLFVPCPGATTPALLSLLFLFMLFAGPPAGAENAPEASPDGEAFLHHAIETIILVSDPLAVSERLTRWAGERGGYFTFKSEERVSLRLPSRLAPELREYLRSLAEQTVTYTQNATDLREEIERLRAGVGSRQEILSRNLSLLDRADVPGTIAVEQEVLRLVGEIETLKGRLRRLENDRRFAAADISFRFLAPGLPTDTPSSFPWINTVDFYSFMEEEL